MKHTLSVHSPVQNCLSRSYCVKNGHNNIIVNNNNKSLANIQTSDTNIKEESRKKMKISPLSLCSSSHTYLPTCPIRVSLSRSHLSRCEIGLALQRTNGQEDVDGAGLDFSFFLLLFSNSCFVKLYFSLTSSVWLLFLIFSYWTTTSSNLFENKIGENFEQALTKCPVVPAVSLRVSSLIELMAKLFEFLFLSGQLFSRLSID